MTGSVWTVQAAGLSQGSSSRGIPGEPNARTLPFSNTTFFLLIANNARQRFRSVNGARSRAQQQQQSRDAARVHVAIFGNAACRRGPTGPLPSPKGRLLRTLRAGCEISLREGQPCLITAKCLFISSFCSLWSLDVSIARIWLIFLPLQEMMDCLGSIQFAVKTIVSLLIAMHR